MGDPGVHAGIAWLGTPIPERHKPNLHPSATDEEKQRPAAVSLAGITATLHVACTQEYFRDWLKVGVIAIAVLPHRQLSLPEDGTLLSPVVGGAPANDGRCVAHEMVEGPPAVLIRWQTDRQYVLCEFYVFCQLQDCYVIVKPMRFKVWMRSNVAYPVSFWLGNEVITRAKDVMITEPDRELLRIEPNGKCSSAVMMTLDFHVSFCWSASS